MAERRMFAKTIIDSDLFIDMPVTARLLYYDLGMRADDDGFVNNPKKIMRMIGASEDDIRVLIAKRFIIPFDSGVVVIRHWRIHNYIQSDRKKDTLCSDEMDQLSLTKDKEYVLDTECIQNVSKLDTQVSIGKDSLGENRIEQSKTKKFIKPSLEDVRAYCVERNNEVDASGFFNYYEANGWKVGKNPMRDWKAAVRYWEQKRKTSTPSRNFMDAPPRDHSEFYRETGGKQ